MSNDFRLDEEQSTLRRARILGFDYIDTTQINPKKLFPSILSVADIKNLRIVPLSADESHIVFGITTTTPQSVIKNIAQKFSDRRNSFVLISDVGYKEYVNLYDPPKKIVYHDIELKDTGKLELVKQISAILDQVRADDMLAYLVAQAHRLNSSDIHIETEDKDVRIRIRIDGVLHVIARISFEKYRVLLAAIASAGNISTGVNEAQQGHISQKIKMADETSVDVNLRLETVPTITGMDIVMRLFNMDENRYTLDRLGLAAKDRQVIDSIISKPTGLVMVVGPTGSGKTTTLYSILNTLNSEELKIITIEDPVEYGFHGISQISVKTNESGDDASFASKLRAVLRLDPDIVMVGEVRDMDTAKTALQASLTGHLVLTTFHAVSASAALTRLADIIGQNQLFVSAIRLIMAQRLVRKLDDKSKIAYDPSELELKFINSVLASLPEGLVRPSIEGLKLYKPGISKENPFGYTGQIVLREQLTISDAVRDIITSPTKVVSTADIEAAAIRSGMTTMLQDGIMKLIGGQTSIQEIFRVIG